MAPRYLFAFSTLLMLFFMMSNSLQSEEKVDRKDTKYKVDVMENTPTEKYTVVKKDVKVSKSRMLITSAPISREEVNTLLMAEARKLDADAVINVEYKTAKISGKMTATGTCIKYTPVEKDTKDTKDSKDTSK